MGSGQDFSADMEISLVKQAAALLAALALGALLGLLYDMIRPVRRRCAAWGAAVLDVLYGMVCGFCVFIYVLAAPGGRLGVWELGFSLLGFLLYLHILSDIVYPLTERAFSLLMELWSFLKKFIKNIWN